MAAAEESIIFRESKMKGVRIPLPLSALGATCDRTQPCSPAVGFISQWQKHKRFDTGPGGLWKESGFIYIPYDHYVLGLFSQ